MMFVSMGVTFGAGTASLFKAHEFTPFFVLMHLDVILYVFLQFTASDFRFGIFKLFFYKTLIYIDVIYI